MILRTVNVLISNGDDSWNRQHVNGTEHWTSVVAMWYCYCS